MAYIFNPTTCELDYYRSDAELNDVYLRLDTTNDPLTGTLTMQAANPIEFRDQYQKIYSSVAGVLNISSLSEGGELQIDTNTLDINASTAITFSNSLTCEADGLLISTDRNFWAFKFASGDTGLYFDLATASIQYQIVGFTGQTTDLNIFGNTFGSMTFGNVASQSDITFDFLATSNSGSFTWMEDEDYFLFSDDIFMNSTEKIFFGDTGEDVYIHSTGANSLKFAATNMTFHVTNMYIGKNANLDTTLTFLGASNDGELKWWEDENYFSFGNEIRSQSTIGLYETDDINRNAIKMTATATNGVLSLYRSAALSHTISGLGVVFNELGHAATDFRIESDTETHIFFVDSSENKIGIATNTPGAMFDVAENIHSYDRDILRYALMGIGG